MKDHKAKLILLALILTFGITLWANNYIGKAARAATVSYFVDTSQLAIHIEADTTAAVNFNEYETYVINGWATWCKPCLKEIPDLNKLKKKHQKPYNKFIALTGEDLEDVSDFIEKKEKQKKPFEFLYEQRYEQNKFLKYLFGINPSADLRVPVSAGTSASGVTSNGIPLNIIIHKGKILFYETGYSKENIRKMDEILSDLEE
ncbi:MAG: TlpA family protein disulfide reductase [Hymenobacteraceae bacterium]|nr:TlpA family protein disulfide reductase [Hymenobacteraceae bacterium]MDX5395557.1 TlpA family protein disulfide reductase [Hymenobacteraceae bacterium]MDX5511611.1 TlpA family protein disulfide reductase [Hymenobacteraceae bacterium]